jgi:gas vesicle protein
MGRSNDYDDDREIERRGGGTFSAFLVGLAIGAGAALLLAPQSGERTRRNLARGAKRVRRQAEEFVRDTRERAEDAIDDARAELESRVDQTRDAFKHRKREVERAMRAGRTAVREYRDQLTDRISRTEAGEGRGSDESPRVRSSDRDR